MNANAADLVRDLGVDNLRRLFVMLESEMPDGLQVKESNVPQCSPGSPDKHAVPDNLKWFEFRIEYERYIRSTLSEAYWASVKASNLHFERYFGRDILLKNIGLKEAENYIVDLQSKVKKGYRVYFRNTKAMFNKAMDWSYIEQNPFLKVKLPRKQDLKPLFLGPQELANVSGHIKHATIREMINFGFYTGCRLSEIVTLTWKNVSLANRTITIGDESFITKTRKQRTIPLCDQVFNLLTERLRVSRFGDDCNGENIINMQQREKYVFANTKGAMISKDYASKRFKKACSAAGLDSGFHFHTLRHSFASNLVQLGVPLYTVKELLGHSSIVTTQIYSHLNMNSLRDAVKVFNPSPSRNEPDARSSGVFGSEAKNG